MNKYRRELLAKMDARIERCGKIGRKTGRPCRNPKNICKLHLDPPYYLNGEQDEAS